MKNKKYILDVCCGNRQFWFNKNHKNTIYLDIRREQKGFVKQRHNIEIQPDVLADFKQLPFINNSFKLVIIDPPHIIADGPLFVMTKKYGWLMQDTWWQDIRNGINECWRVLEEYGILIFKWNEEEVRVRHILELVKHKPLVGHTTGSKSKTLWITFIKE